MKPKISVVVPVYKVEQYIDRCMESLIKQDFDSYEIILVDDGSPDNCGSICDKYAEKYEYVKVVHKKNGGLSSARNAGIQVASGEYLFFVDSDDWVDKKALSTLYNIAVDTEAEIVSGSYQLAKSVDDKKTSDNKIRVFNRDDALEYYLRRGMSSIISEYPAWSKLYKRDLFRDEEFPVGQLYEDVATVFKLIKKTNKYAKTEKIIYYYFQNTSSITHNKFKNSDMDAIKIGKQLVEETKNERESIQKYAFQKEIRGYFSVLCKMAIYGVDSSVKNADEIVNDCVAVLRKNYMVLLSSEMPLSRKAILTGLVLNQKLVFKLFKIIRR